jgi:hypothetical protein
MDKHHGTLKKIAIISIAVILTIILSPLIIGALLIYLARGFVLFLRWNYKYGRQGKSFLAVYSDSPKWKERFPAEILTILKGKAVVINISADSTWKASRSIERLAHQHWGGGRHEYIPIVLYFPRMGRVREVRLREAYFKLVKHGDASELQAQIDELKALAA